MTSPTDDFLAELFKELIASRFPHLRGRLTVKITRAPVLYEVRRGRDHLLVDIGTEVLTHRLRDEIVTRLSRSAQEVHAGLTSAKRVTGLDEIHS